jgi:phage terminase large subunit-like protein
VYGLTPDEDWRDERNWIRVNPSLKQNGGWIELESLRNIYKDALGNPEKEQAFRRFHPNTWLSSNIENVINSDDWKLNTGPLRDDLTDRPCYLGLDLATRTDLAALTAVWPDYETRTYDIKCWTWKPSAGLKGDSRKDMVPYRRWADEGWLSLSEGPVISTDDIVEKVKELMRDYDVREIAVDPWQVAEVRSQLSREGLEVIETRQSIQNLTLPTKYFLESIREGHLRTENNPILTWCAANLAVKADDNGNIRPAKPDIRKTSARIDLCVSTIMALDRAYRHGFDEAWDGTVDFVNLGQ